MKRGIIYARYSSDNQRYESIDAQLRACNSYADQNNIVIVNTYIDEALTGTKDDRENFQRMLTESSLGFFDVVLAHKLDRFARDEYDYHVTKRLLKNNKVEITFVSQDFGKSPEGSLMENVLVGMSAYYSRNLAAEVMKGMNENAYKCKFNGGYVLFGYAIDTNNKYIINDSEAFAVKHIFESYVQGQRYSAIIDWLTLHGYKTRRNKDFTIGAMREMIKNERYTGVYIFNDKTKARKQKTEGIIRVENGMPQIIDNSLFLAATKKIEANRQAPGANSAKRIYLLSGKVKCGCCDYSMQGNTRVGGANKTYYSSYRCTGRRTKGAIQCDMRGIDAQKLESQVLDTLENDIFTDNHIEFMADVLYRQYRESKEKFNNSIRILEKNLKGVESKTQNIVDAIAEGFRQQGMREKLISLEEEMKTIQDSIRSERLRNKVDLNRASLIEFMNLGKGIKSKDPIEQKRIIDMFVNEVVIQKEKVDLSIYLSDCVALSSSGGGS